MLHNFAHLSHFFLRFTNLGIFFITLLISSIVYSLKFPKSDM